VGVQLFYTYQCTLSRDGQSLILGRSVGIFFITVSVMGPRFSQATACLLWLTQSVSHPLNCSYRSYDAVDLYLHSYTRLLGAQLSTDLTSAYLTYITLTVSNILRFKWYIFLFASAFRPSLGPTQLPNQLVGTGGSLPGVKRPRCEADLTTHPHLAPRLIRGAIFQLSHTPSRRGT
jgi:hypothetical protein